MPRICEFGCSYRPGVTFHQFPHPERNPEGFKAWVHVVGGKLETTADTEFYRKKVICGIHFSNEFKNRNNRLNALAVPTLHLYGVSDEVQLPIPEYRDQPSSSRSIMTEVLNDVPMQSVTALPQPELPVPEHQPSKLTETATPFLAGVIAAEHNYTRLSRTHQSPIKEKKLKQMKWSPSLVMNKLRTSRQQLKNLKTEITRLRKRSDTFKARLTSADKISKRNCFQIITKNMTPAAKIFTKMQYTQTHKKPGGRRFSLEEKVLSLSMYKRSPKSYNLLYKYFTLPSSKSLRRLLAKVEVESGLNKSIFIKMKKTVKELSPEDRLCCLIFDEMSISPQIQYDASKDKLKGFTWKGKKIADHVLVYMIKGIKKNFKQPVAYYFTNCLNKVILKDLTKNVIKYVQSTGLTILCTVCDQSATNVSAINEMVEETKRVYINNGKEWRQEIFEVGKSKIIPLFDVPHLLKGVRNNLLTKNMKYFDFEEKKEKTIKWEYFQKVYEADRSYGELKILQKLTDEHIYIDKMKKMKVKAAAQIFSHSVAVAAEHLTGRGDIPEECRQIIKFTKLMDNLFDSLNASSFRMCNGKLYKCAVRRNSPHHELWVNALKVLRTVKFVKVHKEKNNKIRLIESSAIPSIKNFIRTIEGMQHLWKILSQKYSFDSMLTRNFNQDPLENFFGNIRSFGVRNNAPNTIGFGNAYKSLLLNNFNSPHSLQANCEEDNNICLQTVDFFLEEKNTSNVSEYEALQFQHKENEEIVVPSFNLNPEMSDAGQGNYVCGWVLAKCSKVTKSCQRCKNDINGNVNRKTNEYIRAKEYKKGNNLVYPSELVEKYFTEVQNITVEILKKDVPKNGLKEKIKSFIDIFVDNPFTCEVHKIDLKSHFDNTCINVLVYSWCRSINRILSGKITYNNCEDDEMKCAAQMYFNKNKHKK